MKLRTATAAVTVALGCLGTTAGDAAESGRIERRGPAAADSTPTHEATQAGRIAYYAPKFAGRPTASGQKYDPDALTMAHRTLPFGTKVRVTNPANGRSVVVRVNNRGPRGGDLIGDVSLAAAKKLGFVDEGVIEARLDVVERRLAEP